MEDDDLLPILIQIKSILGFENQQKIITRMGDLRTTVIDAVFPQAKRRTNPSPMIKRSDLHAPIKAIALTRRGDGPQRIDDMTMSAEAFEPFPINPYRSISGADLNNFRQWDGKSRESFVARLMDLNRNTIRLTTEAMAAQVLTTGALDYPIMVDGKVTGKYKITFGTIAAISVSKLWSASDAKNADVLRVLVDMQDQIQISGYGSTIKYFAGKTAFYALVNLVESLPNDARIPATVKGNTINFADNEIRLVSETYNNPETGAVVKKVPDTTLIGYAEDAPHDLVYSSLDDIDSNFIAVPFWSKAVKPDTANEIRIISESKPLPVPYTHAVAKAVVTG
jgi:major capsid protein E